MIKRPLVAAGLLVAAAGLAFAGSVRAVEPTAPTCINPANGQEITATKWLDAPGTLTGTPGNDVLIGTTGSDVIKGLGGNDVICGQPIYQYSDPDYLDGGGGNDAISGIGTLLGGAGNDVVQTGGSDSVADGGSGNDDVLGTQGADAYGGTGDDRVRVFEGGVGAGGAGDDLVEGYQATLLGGSGSDLLTAFLPGDYAATKMDCGSGRDTYDPQATLATAIRNCETKVDAGLPIDE